MEIKIKSYSSQSSLISSIIFFILGAILFTNSDKVVSFISIAIGILLAVVGIINLTIYIYQVKKEIPTKKSYIATAVITLILSVIFIFFSDIVEQFIRFIIGAWILLTGITRFINCLAMNTKSRKFLPLLIVSILLMITGVYTIVVSNILLEGIGLIMMIYAAIEIVGYIFYTKDTVTPEEPGTTTLIIPDSAEDEEESETPTKNKKEIKDVTETKEKNSKKKTKKDKKKDNEEEK